MKSKMICFMGLDGSGKSTSIEYAYRHLKESGYRVEIVRAAYVIKYMRPIIQLGKKLLMKHDSDPYAGDYKSYLEKMRRQSKKTGVYRIFSALTTAEFKLQIFFSITLKRFFGITLLVDRYVYDNVVTYAANLGLGEDYIRDTMDHKWKRAPKPDMLIYVKTPVDICFSRKNDIPDPLYLEIREPLYDKVADLYGATIIYGDQSMENMTREVAEAVDRCVN